MPETITPCPTCGTEIKEHPATRCLDALAALALGFQWSTCWVANREIRLLKRPNDCTEVGDSISPDKCINLVPCYSADPGAAILALEGWQDQDRRHRDYSLESLSEMLAYGPCLVVVKLNDYRSGRKLHGYADTLQLAITRALARWAGAQKEMP